MLGAIADDFTGATDLATMLRRSGHRVAVIVGDLEPEVVEDVDAIVVATKTRTASIDEAVERSLAALEVLRRSGAKRFYVKYCSTFDSTPRGNIGPILDAVRQRLGAPRSVVVPSLPANGRTVFQGHLFVGGDLLEDSSMRDHPLTPMTHSRVANLLRAQTDVQVAEVFHQTVAAGHEVLRSALDDLDARYIVVDAIDDEDLRIIGSATQDDRLVSGGSGLALGIPGPGRVDETWRAPETGRRVVLCGSVSERSLEQIEVAARAQPVRTLDVRAAAEDLDGTVRDIVDWILELPTSAIPVVCAARCRDDVLRDVEGVDAVSVVESVLAGVAVRLVERGDSSALLVAGGESSGAVVGALGATVLRIGPEIAPGVCWSLASLPGGPVALALKSGNFGDPEMFTSAWEVL